MKKLLISNLKSNKSLNEAINWFDELGALIDWESLGDYEVGVAPSFPFLDRFSLKINENSWSIKLVTQDISSYPSGKYTGAVSGHNLEGLNISYAVVGHSERRRHFNETSQMVANKVMQALDNGITPILCVDEPYLDEQMSLIDSALLSKCVVCYEPLSAIGTGDNISVKKVEEVKFKVKKLCGDILFMYGGSVNDQNVNEYLLVTDGVLVSSFSLKARNFANLIMAATQNF